MSDVRAQVLGRSAIEASESLARASEQRQAHAKEIEHVNIDRCLGNEAFRNGQRCTNRASGDLVGNL
jgi:hypothetical protein